MWWTFQVSQGSVETLFRWGGKRLHIFAANLFRNLCTKFHQNRPSFLEDITKTVWSLFFRTHCIFLYMQRTVTSYLLWHCQLMSDRSISVSISNSLVCHNASIDDVHVKRCTPIACELTFRSRNESWNYSYAEMNSRRLSSASHAAPQ